MIRKESRSLLSTLSVWYAMTTFFLVAVGTIYLYWSLVQTLSYQDNQLLADRLQTIRMLIALNPTNPQALRQRVEHEWVAHKFERMYVRVTDSAGHILTQTPGVSAQIQAIFEQKDVSDSDQRVFYPAEGLVFRSVASRVSTGAGSTTPVLIKMILDRSNEEKILALYRERLYLVLGLALFICILLGRRLAARAVEPINDMVATAARIRSSTLHERMSQSEMPVELSNLAGTFNGMMDRLEDAFSRLSRFSADLAHELRTPITNLIGEIEVTLGRAREAKFYRDVMGSALEECQRLSHIIDVLLFLARAESPELQVKKERVPLKRELGNVLEFYEAAAAEAGMWYQVDIPESLELEVERTLFHRAVGNIVSNSIKHAQVPGPFCVAAHVSGEFVEIEFKDCGRGIPSRHVERVFDRFYRVDESRSKKSGGSGLGLAIVKTIASIHGGSVDIQSQVEQGTLVTLCLPLCRDVSSR